MSRNKYSAAFKSKVVLEILRGEKEFNTICAEYNLHPGMVRKWRQEFIENAPRVFEADPESKKAQRKEKALKESNDRMAKKIGQLTMERDFLQDCFRKAGYPVPRAPGFDSDEQ